MPCSAPDPATVDRFARDLRTLAPDADRIAVAVSGGPDSLALLLLAHAAMAGSVAAATVDHGLRPESGAEAEFVAGICAELDVSHTLLRVRVDTQVASLQKAARQARYAALANWMQAEGIGTLATAHHLEDQAETLLMRLLRGSGVGGLAGVRSRSRLPQGSSLQQIVRPLLGWRKAELRAIVHRAGLTPIEDPSNLDARFDRSRIRSQLAAADWIDAAFLARSASALADADEALSWAATEAVETRVRAEEDRLVFAHQGLPRELKRRTLLVLLARFDPGATPRGVEMDRLLARLERGESATLAGVKCSGGVEWSLQRAAPRRSPG